MRWSLLSPLLLIGSAAVLVLLERRFPYDRGQKFFRDGFWSERPRCR